MPDDSGHFFLYIGIIHSPFTSIENMPIQPSGADGYTAYAEIDPKFAGGLGDLEGFSYVHLIYHLHRVEGYSLDVIPFLDTESHGIFATRSPKRPNAIGLSTVRLLSIEGNVIRFANPDMIDGTPLMDIKPYVATFDSYDPEREGWFENKASHAKDVRSDRRFLST
jgi:tRNA-Thr(GGU) m(6)t(6)A37 methyltransferase TsaA